MGKSRAFQWHASITLSRQTTIGEKLILALTTQFKFTARRTRLQFRSPTWTTTNSDRLPGGRSSTGQNKSLLQDPPSFRPLQFRVLNPMISRILLLDTKELRLRGVMEGRTKTWEAGASTKRAQFTSLKVCSLPPLQRSSSQLLIRRHNPKALL